MKLMTHDFPVFAPEGGGGGQICPLMHVALSDMTLIKTIFHENQQSGIANLIKTRPYFLSGLI